MLLVTTTEAWACIFLIYVHIFVQYISGNNQWYGMIWYSDTLKYRGSGRVDLEGQLRKGLKRWDFFLMRRIVYSGLASAVVGLLPRTKMNKADSARQSEMGGKLIPSSHYRWSKMFCPGDGPAGGYRTVRRGTLDLFWLKSEFHFLDPLDLLCYIWIWDIRIFSCSLGGMAS